MKNSRAQLLSKSILQISHTKYPEYPKSQNNKPSSVQNSPKHSKTLETPEKILQKSREQSTTNDPAQTRRASSENDESRRRYLADGPRPRRTASEFSRVESGLTWRTQGAPVLGGGSCVVWIGAQMWRHMARGGVMTRVQVRTRAGWPVARCRLEQTARNRDGHRGGRRRHQVQLRVTVAGHEEFALIFVRGRVRCRRLRRRG